MKSKRPASKGIRLVFALGDIHAGSTVALLPPGYTTLEGNETRQNTVQAWLWKCWLDATTTWLPELAGDDPYALVVNGDLTEGIHHHSNQVWSTDTGDHVGAAVEILQPLADKAAKTYIVKGTEVHTGTHEIAIGKILKAEPDPESDKGNRAWDRLSLTVAGTRCIFQHHIASTIRSYLEASGLGIALGNEQLEAAKSGETIPRVLCSAHRHRYGQFLDATGLSLVTPPWQCLSRFGYKVAPSARTRPGIVALDWRGLQDGSIPRVHARTYKAPDPTGATI